MPNVFSGDNRLVEPSPPTRIRRAGCPECYSHKQLRFNTPTSTATRTLGPGCAQHKTLVSYGRPGARRATQAARRSLAKFLTQFGAPDWEANGDMRRDSYTRLKAALALSRHRACTCKRICTCARPARSARAMHPDFPAGHPKLEHNETPVNNMTCPISDCPPQSLQYSAMPMAQPFPSWNPNLFCAL